jgi:vancomycin resistance protein VanJ
MQFIAARVSTVLSSLGRFLITTLLTGAMALAIALRPGLSEGGWIELLRYVPYPLLLTPMLVALALSLTLGWLWRLVALVGVAIIAILVMGLTIGTPETGSVHLRLMTYNIKSYRVDERPDTYERIADEIRRHSPDVQVLQDAQYFSDGNQPTPEPLQRLWTGWYVHKADQYVVASRYPLRDCRLLRIGDEGLGSNYLRCTVVVGDQLIDLATVHFLSPRDGLNAARYERLEGIDDWQANFALRLGQALDMARDLPRLRQQDSMGRPVPLIVAGDLNAPESSPVVQALIATGLRDAWSRAATGYGYTYGHWLRPHINLLRIDHILVSPQLAVERAQVGGAEGSEHLPVIADLWLSRE